MARSLYVVSIPFCRRCYMEDAGLRTPVNSATANETWTAESCEPGQDTAVPTDWSLELASATDLVHRGSPMADQKSCLLCEGGQDVWDPKSQRREYPLAWGRDDVATERCSMLHSGSRAPEKACCCMSKFVCVCVCVCVTMRNHIFSSWLLVPDVSKLIEHLGIMTGRDARSIDLVRKVTRTEQCQHAICQQCSMSAWLMS